MTQTTLTPMTTLTPTLTLPPNGDEIAQVQSKIRPNNTSFSDQLEDILAPPMVEEEEGTNVTSRELANATPTEETEVTPDGEGDEAKLQGGPPRVQTASETARQTAVDAADDQHLWEDDDDEVETTHVTPHTKTTTPPQGKRVRKSLKSSFTPKTAEIFHEMSLEMQQVAQHFLKFINSLNYVDTTRIPVTDSWKLLEVKKLPQNRVRFIQQFMDKELVHSQCLTFKIREKLLRALPFWVRKEEIIKLPPGKWFKALKIAYDALFSEKNRELMKKGVNFTISEVRTGDPKPTTATTTSTTMEKPTSQSKLDLQSNCTMTKPTTHSQVNVHLEPVITIRPSENGDQFDENLTRVRGENDQKHRSFSQKLRENSRKIQNFGEKRPQTIFDQNDQNLVEKRAEIFDEIPLCSRYSQREISPSKLSKQAHKSHENEISDESEFEQQLLHARDVADKVMQRKVAKTSRAMRIRSSSDD